MSGWDDFPLVAQNPNAKGTEETEGWDQFPLTSVNPRWQAEQPKPVATKQPEPLGPWDASWERFKGSSRTGAAGFTQMMGWDEWTKELLGQAEANEKEASRYKPQVPSYQDIYKEDDLLGSAKRLGRYAYEGVAESAANMGATAAGAIAGLPLGPAGMIAGGVLANVPSYTGSNLQRQMQEQGIPFDQTSMAKAFPSAVAQSGLDTALGYLLPGVGKAAAGNMFVRALKKGAQGVGIEGATEAAQQAIEILQANPDKLWEFGPEVQAELTEAAIKGGLLGGMFGGASGAINARKEPAEQPAETSPQGEETLTEPPPPTDYFPPSTEYPAYPSYENVPPGTSPPVDVPVFNRSPDWQPMGYGLPVEPGGEMPPDMGYKTVADKGIAPSRAIEKNGQLVFNDIKEQLYGRYNPIQVNAIAKFERERYETLGAQLGVSPWDAYAASNVKIDVGGKKPEIIPTTDPAMVLNQDEAPIEDDRVVMRSALTSAANRIRMKEGTGQQWLNALKKEGVKDEELEWSGVRDFLTQDGDRRISQPALQMVAGTPYKIGVYEAKPHDQGKTNHYGQWTLGQYGSNPESNYREVVISDEALPAGTYTSSHFQMVPNPLGHYRTTDRVTVDGAKTLHMEEAQSDWHQEGKKIGYITNEYGKRLDDVLEELSRLNTQSPTGTREDRIQRLQRISFLQEEATRLEGARNSGVAKGPYQQSWPNMLFRHALADAINSDKDALTWNTGKNMMQVEDFNENDAGKLNAMQSFYDKRIVDYANKLGKPFGIKVEKKRVHVTDVTPEDVKLLKELGHDAREGPIYREVWSLPINDVMREVLRAGGLPLFQREGIKPKGNISLLPDQTIIRIFKNGDVSTAMHEFSHLHLSELERYAPKHKGIAQDLATFKAFAGLEPDGKITANEQELWARTFEEWLATGKAPNKALRDLFEQFRQWLIDIYKKMQNIVAARPKEYRDLKLSREMRGVFDRLVSMPSDPVTEERQSPLPPPRGDRMLLTQQGQAPGKIRRGIDWMGQKWDDVFDAQSRVPNKTDYLDERLEVRGADYAADQAGKAATKLYEKLNPEQQEIVTQYFEGKRPITDVPQPLRAETRAIRDRVMELGQRLVDHGVLDKKTYEANKGKYSPNLYMKHFLEGKGFVGGMRPNLDPTKKRKKLSEEEKIALGIIRHPAVTMGVTLARLGRSAATLDFMNNISKNPDWFHPRSTIDWNGHRVTPDWLKAEAVEIDKRAREIEKINPDQAKEMRDIAQAMDEKANTVLDQDYDPKEWKKLPDTRSYGKLRGGWVRKQIANDISGITDFADNQSWAAKLLGDNNSMLVKGTQAWKMAKVVWNPASHGRNAIGNIIQMNVFGGVPIPKLPKYIKQAASEMKAGHGKAWDVAKRYGVPHGNMGEAEFRALATDVAKTMEGASAKGPGMLLNIGRLFSNTAQKYYQGAESLFKTAVIAHELDKGTSPKAAVRAADEALFDYNNIPPSVRYLRNSPLGAPFIVWNYKALPMLMKTMTDKKTVGRYLPYVALSYLVPSLVASMNDLKDDDPERLKLALSETLRRKHSMYQLPWKDENGRWQFLDVGYFLPWSMPWEVGAALAKGDAGEAAKASPLLSSPVISVAAAVKTGIDPFTGRPIMDKRDPPYDQVVSLLKYVWDLGVPSVLASHGLAGKAYDNVTGTGTNRYGEPPADWMQIAARGAGLNTYSVDPEAQRARNLRKMDHDIKEIRSQWLYNMKDQSLTMEQRKALAERFQSKIRDRYEDMAKYQRDSAMTPSLRATSTRQ